MADSASNKRNARSAAASEPAAIARTRKLLKAPAARREFDATVGYLELLDDRGKHVTPATIAMKLPVVSAVYERWWRPGLTRIAKGLSGPTMSDEYSRAQQLMHLTRGTVALDLGCGPGNFSRRFARTVGAEGLVVGYDGSRAMLDQAVAAEDELPQLAYVYGEATALPFKANTFDSVCCFAALNMFPEPFETLGEIARVLRPGGRVALLTSNISVGGPPALAARAFGFFSGMTMFGEDQLRSALEDLGMTVEVHEAAGATQMIGAVLRSTSGKS